MLETFHETSVLLFAAVAVAEAYAVVAAIAGFARLGTFRDGYLYTQHVHTVFFSVVVLKNSVKFNFFAHFFTFFGGLKYFL